MVWPLAIAAASTKVTGESYTSREGIGKLITVNHHLACTGITRNGTLDAPALDDEGVDVRIPLVDNLIWPYATEDDHHPVARQQEGIVLQLVLNVRAQLLLADIDFEQAAVVGYRIHQGGRQGLRKSSVSFVRLYRHPMWEREEEHIPGCL
jgi:hypothetical protein